MPTPLPHSPGVRLEEQQGTDTCPTNWSSSRLLNTLQGKRANLEDTQKWMRKIAELWSIGRNGAEFQHCGTSQPRPSCVIPARYLAKQQKWPECLGLWHPHGWPRWSTWLLAVTWPGSGYCGHLRS